MGPTGPAGVWACGELGQSLWGWSPEGAGGQGRARGGVAVRFLESPFVGLTAVDFFHSTGDDFPYLTTFLLFF